jgi:CRP-like cAMP-binding protein
VWANVLGEVPLFAGLSRRHLNKVAGVGRLLEFHHGAAIVRAGQPGDAMYVVVDGDVAVRRPGLPEVSLGTGSFFGEMALLDGGPRSATVVAKGPVVCVMIQQSRFMKLLRSEPAIAVELLKEVASRLRAVQAAAV